MLTVVFRSLKHNGLPCRGGDDPGVCVAGGGSRHEEGGCPVYGLHEGRSPGTLPSNYNWKWLIAV